MAYDNFWQEPAITEYSAYLSVKRLNLENCLSIYIAFPWATYIDLIRKKDSRDSEKFAKISCAYQSLVEILKSDKLARKNIVTTCQHIHAYEHEGLFREFRITDLFWSHKKKSQEFFGNIKLHPFPLYPVHSSENSITSVSPRGEFDDFIQRKYLCSFVGLTKHPGYPNDLRAHSLNIAC